MRTGSHSQCQTLEKEVKTMALRWQFDEPGGTVTVQNAEGAERTDNWYEGNALMIVTNEWEKDGESYYSLGWFLADEAHAKACLGLAKDSENMFAPGRISKLTINRKHCYQWKKLVSLMTKAFPDIEIVLN